MRPRLTRPRLQLAAGLAVVVAVTGLGIVLTDGPATTGDRDVVIAGDDPTVHTTGSDAAPADGHADDATVGTDSTTASSAVTADTLGAPGDRRGSRPPGGRKSSGSARRQQKAPAEGRRSSDGTTTSTIGTSIAPPGSQPAAAPGPCTADDLDVLLQPLLPDASGDPEVVGLAPKVEVRGPRPCTTTSDDRWAVDVFDHQGRRVFHLSHALDEAGAPPRVRQPGELILFSNVWQWYLDCAAMPPLDDAFSALGDRQCLDSEPGTFTITFSVAGVAGRLFPADIGPTPDTIVVP